MARPPKKRLTQLGAFANPPPISAPLEKQPDHRPLDPDCPCSDCAEYNHDPEGPNGPCGPCGCIECDPENFTEDDDDEEDDAEEAGALVQSSTVADVVSGGGGLPLPAAGAPAPPVPGESPAQKLVPAFLPVGENPWEFPSGAAYALLSRVVAGKPAPVGYKMPTGQIGHRIGPAEGLSTDMILHYWGKGAYVVQFHSADGKFMGKRRPVELVEGADKPLVYVPPSPERPAAAPPPAPPQAAHAPAPDPMSLLAAVGNPAVASNPLALFVAFKQFFDQDTEARLARERRDADARVERMRWDQQMALHETQERHRRMLEEDQARHRRDLEHQNTLSRSLIESSADARRRRDLEQEIDELRGQVSDKQPADPGVLGGIINQLAPLIPLGQQFLQHQVQQAQQAQQQAHAQQHARAVAARAAEQQARPVEVRDVTPGDGSQR